MLGLGISRLDCFIRCKSPTTCSKAEEGEMAGLGWGDDDVGIWLPSGLYKKYPSLFGSGAGLSFAFFAMIAAAIALAIAAMILTRRSAITLCSPSGEWARLKGVAPKAIAHLQALPPPPDYPSDKSSRIYLTRLAKFRLVDWCRILGWEFKPCFNIAIAKWLRPRSLDSRGLIRLEQVISTLKI
jgi:hypothetical protein